MVLTLGVADCTDACSTCLTCLAVGYNVNDGGILGPGCPASVGDATDAGELAAANIAFVGPWAEACNASYDYPAPLQVALKTWVEAGGRLFLTADNLDCFNGGDPFNSNKLNSFLGFLGSGIQLTGSIVGGCPSLFECSEGAPEAIGIMNGLPGPFYQISAGEVSGGTPLAQTAINHPFSGCDVPHVFMAVEQIGSGLVVLSASSRVFGDCDTTGACEFYRRLCSWSVADILEV